MASVFHHLLAKKITILIIVANVKLVKIYKMNGLKILLQVDGLCVPQPPRKKSPQNFDGDF